MTIAFEKNRNKDRPALPRASDLGRVPNVALVEAARKRTEGRDANGRFAASNPHGLGSRWKASIKKSLGPKACEGDAEIVYRDAFRIYLATLRAMPSDAAPVRSLAALHARHMALHGYFSTAAVEAGLTTDMGASLQSRADQQSARAERVLVSCIAAAKALAVRTTKGTTVASMRDRVEAELAKGSDR